MIIFLDVNIYYNKVDILQSGIIININILGDRW